MKTTTTTDRYKNLKPGDDVDSWCGKCKMMLAHTIEAMADKKPARVICNTCKSTHGFKAQPPNSKPRAAKTGTATGVPRAARTAGNRYRALSQSQESVAPEVYSPKNRYEPGRVLDHPMFGRGYVTAVREGYKMEVHFESGPKTLIHSR